MSRSYLPPSSSVAYCPRFPRHISQYAYRCFDGASASSDMFCGECLLSYVTDYGITFECWRHGISHSLSTRLIGALNSRRGVADAPSDAFYLSIAGRCPEKSESATVRSFVSRSHPTSEKLPSQDQTDKLKGLIGMDEPPKWYEYDGWASARIDFLQVCTGYGVDSVTESTPLSYNADWEKRLWIHSTSMASRGCS